MAVDPTSRKGQQWLVPALVLSALLHAVAMASVSRLPAKPLPRQKRDAIQMAMITRPRPAPTVVVPPPEPTPPPVVKPKVIPPPAAAPKATPQQPPPVEPQEPQPPPLEVAPPKEEPTPPPVVVTTPSPGSDVTVPRRAGSPDGVPGGKGLPSAGALFLTKEGAARLALKEKVVTPPEEQAAPPSLERKEWKHKGFFAQVKSFIRQRWKPERMLRERARRDKLNGIVGGKTVVRITIDDRGNIVDTSVTEPGPADWLDEAALKAARSAGPFVNPPVGLFDKNGRFSFTFGFKVSVFVPSQLARILKPNDNVVEAVTNMFTSEVSDSLWCFRQMEACGKDCADEETSLHAQMEPCHYK
jgi:TonB family protein